MTLADVLAKQASSKVASFLCPCAVITVKRPLFSGAHRTKYVDNLFSQLSESKIQFMFSESQTETASIAAALLKKELKKDQGLPKNLNLDKFQEAFLLPFYQVSELL